MYCRLLECNSLWYEIIIRRKDNTYTKLKQQINNQRMGSFMVVLCQECWMQCARNAFTHTITIKALIFISLLLICVFFFHLLLTNFHIDGTFCRWFYLDIRLSFCSLEAMCVFFLRFVWYQKLYKFFCLHGNFTPRLSILLVFIRFLWYNFPAGGVFSLFVQMHIFLFHSALHLFRVIFC